MSCKHNLQLAFWNTLEFMTLTIEYYITVMLSPALHSPCSLPAACGCDPHGSVRTACNDTGVCECQPNVQGDRCDACIPDHYGLYTGGHLEHSVGSLHGVMTC